MTTGFVEHDELAGWVRTRNGFWTTFDAPNLPEGEMYRVFIGTPYTFDGVLNRTVFLDKHLDQVFRDSIASPAKPLDTKVAALPGDQGYRRAYAESALKSEVSSHGAICLIDAGGKMQVVGVVCSDPELWQARHAWLETFVEHLTVNEKAPSEMH